MIEFFLTKVDTKIKGVFKTTGSILLIAIMAFVTVFSSSELAFAATGENQELWAITIRDKEIVYVNSEQEGKQVISSLKNSYVGKNCKVVDVKLDPLIQVNKVNEITRDEAGLSAKSEKAVDVNTAVKRIRAGETLAYKYKTLKGDSLYKIAKRKNLSTNSLYSLNGSKYGVNTVLKTGTTVTLYKKVPFVNVKTVERLTTTSSKAYKTEYRKSSKVMKNTSKVSRAGKKGSVQSIKQIVRVNGKTTSSKLISSKVVRKPTNKVVLRGTGTVKAKAGVSYSFNKGTNVVEYAKKFMGNPYRYGGTSLTKGADCSGFVYSVYKHFGVNLPRVGQSSVGKKVSYKNVKKGDILIYSGHVAIYAGNGKAVHSVNERMGIKVTSVGYTGKVIAVRRIFK